MGCVRVCANPDAVAAEFTDRGAVFSTPLKDTEDSLQGFELTDPDGYVLFFSRPRSRYSGPVRVKKLEGSDLPATSDPLQPTKHGIRTNLRNFMA